MTEDTAINYKYNEADDISPLVSNNLIHICQNLANVEPPPIIYPPGPSPVLLSPMIPEEHLNTS